MHQQSYASCRSCRRARLLSGSCGQSTCSPHTTTHQPTVVALDAVGNLAACEATRDARASGGCCGAGVAADCAHVCKELPRAARGVISLAGRCVVFAVEPAYGIYVAWEDCYADVAAGHFPVNLFSPLAWVLIGQVRNILVRNILIRNVLAFGHLSG